MDADHLRQSQQLKMHQRRPTTQIKTDMNDLMGDGGAVNQQLRISNLGAGAGTSDFKDMLSATNTLSSLERNLDSYMNQPP
jgi:hypothetical protein